MRMPSMSSSKVILIGRVLILGLAVGAVVIGFVVTRPADDRPVTTRVSYVCPMHPQVTSSSPGDCPICRMALEPVTAHPAPTAARAPTSRDPAGDSGAFSLPAGAELRRFDAVARVKQYETSLEMRAPAWADSTETGLALLHLDESELLEPNEEAIFYPSSRPKDGAPPGILVHATGEPSKRWDRATTLVRFHVAAGAKLSASQTGSIKFATRVRNGLVVRASAVLESPDGPYVLVVGDDRRTLTKRPIEIGSVLYGYAALMAGLHEDESVAATHTFFLDAERRLRGGAR